MKKFVICFILFAIISIIFISHKLDKAEIEKGVLLDIAREHYSEKSIKEIIQKISHYNGNYLQLHFSDNENYSIYSKVLNQTSDKSNSYFLTKHELKSIIQYANDRHVQIIPELDLPGHSKAILTLLKKNDPEKYKKVVSNYDSSTIDFNNNQNATKMSKDLIKEVSQLFYQSKYKDDQQIALGGDEVAGSGSQQNEFIKYINAISKDANAQNYNIKIWNDSINKSGLKQLNQNITIMYWQQKSKNSLEPKDFYNANHEVENFNGNTMYIFPRQQSNTAINHDLNTISNTKITDFNTKTQNLKSNSNPNLNGEYLSFWGEFSSKLDQKQLLDYIFKAIETFFNK